jgi:2-polyprenyl-3-methyl-5-hydroxy-6-metoxy-1,4-benzoquinol methylase
METLFNIAAPCNPAPPAVNPPLRERLDEAVKKSHNAHRRHGDELIEEPDIHLNYIYRQDTKVYQSKIRTLDMLRPFWQTPNSWLTIGDYNGLEANWLQQKGQDVTASDISDTVLKEAYKRGGINKFRQINVEQIDCENETFGYVSCREAFHHFPRAYLGLYEMIRVASKAA